MGTTLGEASGEGMARRPEQAVTTGVARPWLRDGLSNAGPIAIAGLVANGGSLVVTVALARLLAARDYGALNQLIGVFFVVSTPGTAVLVAVVRRVTAWDPCRDGVLAQWVARLHRTGGVVLFGFAACVGAAGPAIAGLLGRGDPLGIDAAAVAGALWVLLCVDRGLIQSRRRYRALAGNLLVEGSLRTVLMVAFGAAGLGARGVAVGILAAEALTAAHARFLASRPTWERAPSAGDPAVEGTSSEPALVRARGLGRGDLATACVTLGAVALLQYVDVLVLVKDEPRRAGAYAAVSVATKALVFLALVLGGYLLPEAAIAWRLGRHALRQLAVTFGVLAIPAAVLVSVSLFAPRPALDTVFSGRYVSASAAFAPLAGAMVCLSAVVVLSTYLLAVGDRMIGLVVAGAAVAAVFAVSSAHGHPEHTATADLVVQAVLLVVASAELVRVHRLRLARTSPASGVSRLQAVDAAAPAGADLK